MADNSDDKQAKQPAALTLEQKLWAAVKDSDEVQVKELLGQGAKANYEAHDPGVWGASHRESIIHVALKAKPINGMIIQMLLDAGANPNANYEDYNWKGSGSTETAFQMALQYSIHHRDAQVLQMFLATKKVEINNESTSSVSTMRYDGSESWYPIHTAARGCFYEGVKLLLEHGAHADAIATNQGQSEYGSGSDTKETSLHIVCNFAPSNRTDDEPHYGHTNDEICNTAQVLIQHGANVNGIMQRIDCLDVKVSNPAKKDEDTWQDPRSGHYISPYVQVQVQETPLHKALLKNNTRLALLLLKNGADHTIPWVYGSEEVPTVNLMSGNMLASIWSPQTHQFFPKDIQKRIKAILLVARRLQWNIPKEILYDVIKYSLCNVKNEWSMEEFLNEQKKMYQAQREVSRRAVADLSSGGSSIFDNEEKPATRQRSKTLPARTTKSNCIIS